MKWETEPRCRSRVETVVGVSISQRGRSGKLSSSGLPLSGPVLGPGGVVALVHGASTRWKDANKVSIDFGVWPTRFSLAPSPHSLGECYVGDGRRGRDRRIKESKVYTSKA